MKKMKEGKVDVLGQSEEGKGKKNKEKIWMEDAVTLRLH
jgi:hypothetical protein